MDGNRSVDIGSADIWFSIYSTALDFFGRDGNNVEKVSKAISFMETGRAEGIDGYEIARQFNLIRDEFSRHLPEEVVYDINNREKKAPWNGNVSHVITSCGNLYTTSDGLDLFYEIVSIFVYAKLKRTEVIVE